MARALTAGIGIVELPSSTLWTTLKYSGLVRKHSDIIAPVKFGHVLRLIYTFLSLTENH